MIVNDIRIPVRDGIQLSEIRPGDSAAFVKHLNDEDIYQNTLRIPYPYTDDDAEKFIEIVTEAITTQGHPVQFAIHCNDDELIGSCGFDGLRVCCGAWKRCETSGNWCA